MPSDLSISVDADHVVGYQSLMRVVAVLAVALVASVAHAEPAPATAAAPAATVGKRKLLVLDVKGADLDKSQVEALTSFIAARAAHFSSLEVTSSADIRDLVSLEATKEQAGCDDEKMTCLAEVAGALGAELVLSTRAGKLDSVFVVSLQLFDAKTASSAGRASVQGWSLADLPEKIGPAVDEMLQKATGEAPTVSAVVLDKSQKPGAIGDGLRTGFVYGGGIGAGVGVVAVVAGAVPAFLYGSAKDQLAADTRKYTGDSKQLDAAAQTHKDARAYEDAYNGAGRYAVIAGVVLVVLGGGALAAGLLLPSTEGGAE